MGTHTRPAREGLCNGFHALTGTGLLHCDREAGHPGIHRDNVENLYWQEGAPPLEVIELPEQQNRGE